MSGAGCEGEDVRLAWAEVPSEVRAAISARTGGGLPEGHTVWRCPRRSHRGWFRPSGVVIEYWWIDEAGELVDAIWFS